MERIKEQVMTAIQEGGIHPHSKWYFFIRNSIYILAGIILVLSTLYVGSFIIFAFQASGLIFLSRTGFFGIGIILQELPWVLVLFVMLGIFLTLLLSKSSYFSYRTPTLYVFTGIVVVLVAGSFVMSGYNLHRSIYTRGYAMPPVRMLYENFADPERHHGTPGEIVAIYENGISITTPRNEIVEIVISSSTEVMANMGLDIGEKVFVVGRRASASIDAEIIREITEQQRGKLFMKGHMFPVEGRPYHMMK